MKPCPPGKELNPKTNRCVKVCNDGFVRDDNFKCVKDSKPETTSLFDTIKDAPGKIIGLFTPEPKQDITIDEQVIYNREGLLTYADYEGYKNSYLRDIYSILTNKPTGRKFIYGLSNRKLLIDAILKKQDVLRPIIVPVEPSETPVVEPEPEPGMVEDTIIPVVDRDLDLPLQNIDENYVNNMDKRIPSFIIDKETDDVNFEDNLGPVPQDVESSVYNQYMNKKERYERQTTAAFEPLYPTLDDPKFSVKIAQKQEFAETMNRDKVGNIEEEIKKYENADFELSPNQLFVKNFMSAETPYNGLLLYHGVGTGKTCSAIGVAEDVRHYNKQNNIRQRIIIVASPNVQKSFMSQLFNEARLEKTNGYWNISACVSKQLIHEVNPTHTKDVAREVIVRQIQNLIKSSYLFMGYVEFSRFMQKSMTITDEVANQSERKRLEIQSIRKTFDNRLVIVDEAHNIRTTSDNKKKQIGTLFLRVARYSKNMKILLLSATPMYNSQSEIIWITNLLNANDGRSVIKEADVFSNDSFNVSDDTENESGEELIRRKLTGYVSFVRGENPYSFPFRVYPDTFSPDKLIGNYPLQQFNGIEITSPLEYTQVYTHKMTGHQRKTYNDIIQEIKGSEKVNMENMQTFGYTLLLKPIEANVITYPTKKRVGREGFAEVMNFKQETVKREDSTIMLKHQYSYKPEILKEYGRIFAPDKIGNYSTKIAEICKIVKKSTGIILIYSQFIDSGIVPMAIALEEIGFGRYSSTSGVKPLLKATETAGIDSIEMVEKELMLKPDNYRQAKYCVITGDPYLSHNNAADLERIVRSDNTYGERVKVILISKAAAEGLDFKNIRQVHVIDPWYNMNRIEQIIGRAVRFRSHISLPVNQRNVEIYLHGCHDEKKETVDMYMYRLAETKAKQIGNITRVLKEVSVDCHLNIGQSELTAERLAAISGTEMQIELSTGDVVPFKPGDRPFTQLCDYKDNCSYTCNGTNTYDPTIRDSNTYGAHFARMHYDAIARRVHAAFKEAHVYTQSDLIQHINLQNQYPREQIFFVLSQMIDNGGEIIIDKSGRRGTLVNREKYYAFQPIEINDERISVLERSAPIEYKRDKVIFKNDVIESSADDANVDEVVRYREITDRINSIMGHIQETMPDNAITSKSDWYEYASTEQTQKLILDKHHIPRKFYENAVMRHYIDELNADDKILMLTQIHNKSKNNGTYTLFDTVFAKYMDEHTVIHDDRKAVVIIDCKRYRLIMIDDDIVPATPVDYEDFQLPVANHFLVQIRDLFPEIGFIVTAPRFAFKLKSMGDKYNNRGARCFQATKADIIARLRCIMNGEYCKTPFQDENSTGDYEDEDTKDISKQGLCVVTEVLFRYMDSIRYRNKRYFMDPEQALVNQAEKI